MHPGGLAVVVRASARIGPDSRRLYVRRAAAVLAQTVSVHPDAAGMPGGDLIQRLLNWAQMLALWGSLGAILAGAAMYGLAQQGNSYAGASRGKTLAMGGVVGAILAGLAPAAVNLLFSAAGG
jgi:hypothetical protein